MTNREKTRELARKHQGTMTDAQYLSMFNAIEEMAEWKDKQLQSMLNCLSPSIKRIVKAVGEASGINFDKFY